MTMQSSGAISLGQAGSECTYGYGSTIDAGNNNVSELGYRSPGQALAWSYWYGQTYLVPIPNQLFANVVITTDRYFYFYMNYRTGGYNYSYSSSANGTGVNSVGYYRGAISLAGSYTGFSGSVSAYSARGPVTEIQAPSSGNDFTIGVEFDDNAPNGSAAYGVYLYVAASSRFG